MANSYLYRTHGTPTAGTKYSFSAWVKRSKITSRQRIFTVINPSDTASYAYLEFTAADKLYFNDFNGGSDRYDRTSSAVFRDTNAFYHIMCFADTTASTNADRMKIYVNGEEISYSGTENGSLSSLTGNTSGKNIYIGYHGTSSMYFDGVMAHVHFIDGTVYQASDFGSTDSTTGIWKPKISPSVTYGNNGFFLDFADSSALGDDESGNTNDLTVSGNLKQTLETPSNIFANLSPQLLPRGSGETIKFNNLFFGTSAAIWNTESSTFGISKGKYYFEVKLSDNGSDRRFRWGLQKESALNGTGENKVLGGADNDAIGYKTQGESATQGGYFINQTSTALTDGDINVDGAIYGFAIDLDNQRMYGHMNGTYFHSGNPSAGTGGIDVSSFYTVGETLFPSFTVHNANIEINFGTGFFGTTAVASAGTNAGVGTFEFDCPTGFKAICTKSINEQEYS